jgi:hypothetical protein
LTAGKIISSIAFLFSSFVVHLNKSEIGFSITLATCAFHYVACDGGGGVEGPLVTVEIKT